MMFSATPKHQSNNYSYAALALGRDSIAKLSMSIQHQAILKLLVETML